MPKIKKTKITKTTKTKQKTAIKTRTKRVPKTKKKKFTKIFRKLHIQVHVVTFYLLLLIVSSSLLMLLYLLNEEKVVFNTYRFQTNQTKVQNLKQESDLDLKDDKVKHCIFKNENNETLYNLYINKSSDEYYIYLNFDQYHRQYYWNFAQRRKCTSSDSAKVFCKHINKLVIDLERKEFSRLYNLLLKKFKTLNCEDINYKKDYFSIK